QPANGIPGRLDVQDTAPRASAGTMRISAGNLIVRGGELLLAKRAEDRTFYPRVWDMVGGHCEGDETPADALARELGEELPVAVGTEAFPPRVRSLAVIPKMLQPPLQYEGVGRRGRGHTRSGGRRHTGLPGASNARGGTNRAAISSKDTYLLPDFSRTAMFPLRINAMPTDTRGVMTKPS